MGRVGDDLEVGHYRFDFILFLSVGLEERLKRGIDIFGELSLECLIVRIDIGLILERHYILFDEEEINNYCVSAYVPVDRFVDDSATNFSKRTKNTGAETTV